VGPARAEDGRRRYIEARDHSSVLPLIAEKLFGWCGLPLIVIATGRIRRLQVLRTEISGPDADRYRARPSPAPIEPGADLARV
jgi:hypothetical protein